MLTRGKWIGTLLLLSGVLWPTAGQTAPTATFVAHRGTSGGVDAAPVYVHFDATATTSSIAGDKPFFDLLFEWDFGDTGSGNWSTDGMPRNRALGGVAGHVFERPGSYVVRLTVTDRTGAKSTFQRTVVVDDPNDVWPVTNRTACISSTGNFTDCPSSGAARFTSSNFGSALTNALNAGYRRILYRRGDSFTGGAYTAPNPANVLVGAYGSSGPRPLINFTGGGGVAALGVTGNDWRVQDLEFQPGPGGSTLHGISTDAEVNDFLILRNRIIVATDRDDIFTPTNGPPFVSDRIAIVDNDLRGNVNAVTLGSSSGACYYGGSYQNAFLGNTCGKSSAWQIRIIFNDRSVFQHNVVQENGGAFECVKYHCAGDQSVVCRHNVVSDNVCMKERFNVTAGRAEDGNTIIDSVFERNMVPDMITEQPGNLYRHNVVGRFRLAPRLFNASFTRNNQYVNNTCYSPSGSFSQCFLTLPGSDATGTVLRNNLFWSQGAPTPTISLIQGSGGGAMTQQGNQVVAGGTSPFVSSTPRRLADFALRSGSTLINSGVAGSGPTVDLVGNLAPLGLPDIGAVEFGSGGPVVVDAPPAPPVLLSVDVQP